MPFLGPEAQGGTDQRWIDRFQPVKSISEHRDKGGPCNQKHLGKLTDAKPDYEDWQQSQAGDRS
ncbi:hypothetical protein D3C76_1368060 [compost metagenome]